MTRTHYDAVSLESLVHLSHAIVLARPSKPAERIEVVSILPDGSAFAGRNEPPYYEPPYHDADPGPHLDKNYPPYQRRWHRVVVTAVLKPGPGVAVGDTLEVCEGNTESQESLHRGYYLEGRRKSPIYQCYQAAGEFGERDERIVFAVRRSGRWSLPVAWALEVAARRAEVERLVAAGPPPGSIFAGPT